jgi:hypothetical protein
MGRRMRLHKRTVLVVEFLEILAQQVPGPPPGGGMWGRGVGPGNASYFPCICL